jgi:hypothetical protein
MGNVCFISFKLWIWFPPITFPKKRKYRVCLFFRKLFFKFFYICLSLEKLVNGKHFPVKEKFGFISKKVFPFYFGRKTLSRSCENLKISYYLLIMSNLVIKILIAIYFVWIFFFSNSSLKIWFNLIFILTLVLIFMIVIYFSLIIF